MLDDRERRLWQDIESRLAADDPGFRRRMRAADRPRRDVALLVWAALCCLVTVLLSLLGGWPAGVAGAVVCLLFLPMLLRRARRRRQAQQHGPDRH